LRHKWTSIQTPISRLEIVERGGRRRFSDEAKLRIVEESYSGRHLGSATARKYGITRAQLNDWPDAARAGRFDPASSSGFVPAVIVPEVTAASDPLMVERCGQIEIVTTNERPVIVDLDVDVEALPRIVQALERLA
jgi:transposase